MLALSVRQPWAWAILHAGKRIENRSWATKHRGPILLHASRRYDMDGKHWIQNVMGIKVPPNLPCGGIVGRVELADCFEPDRVGLAIHNPTLREYELINALRRTQWWQGPVGWYLVKPEPLPFMPCQGKLGLFHAPEQGVLELGP